MLGAADQDVGLNPDFTQFGHALLTRLCFQFCGSLQVGEQCAVEEEDVAVADFKCELSHRFEERQALDIPDCATEFGDQHIHIVFAALVNPLFDFVGYVGDDLDRGSEIVTAPLFLNDPLVNLPGGQIIEAAEFARGETLVVPEVEVGLGPVVEDIHLSVLEWDSSCPGQRLGRDRTFAGGPSARAARGVRRSLPRSGPFPGRRRRLP